MAYLLHQLPVESVHRAQDKVAVIAGSSANLQKSVRKILRGDKDA